MKRGLRQGDLLSPFLFLIVAEALQAIILESCNKGLFKGLKLKDEATNIFLLQYGDDALIFREWSRMNVKNLISILNSFRDVSGLFKSSIIGVGVNIKEVKKVASSSNCKFGSLPFIYLGLPVGRDMSKGFKEGEKGIVWVKCKSILSRFDKGGLGVGSVHAKNLSLLAKWRWRYYTECDALWHKVICNLYGHAGGYLPNVGRGCKKVVWASILSAGSVINNMGIPLNSSFIRKVGNGESILFYKERWLDAGPILMECFPRLYALESIKDYSLRDQCARADNEWRCSWEWCVPSRSRALANYHMLDLFVCEYLYVMVPMMGGIGC
nr:RNA-directed DNA polymerase, eukaryota, reverse transcriptase zinc-binding domain protein [Tanacetum cinerariifolium]